MVFFQFASCEVVKKKETGIEVHLLPSRKTAFLPKMHLSDSVEMCDAMMKVYKEKDPIDKVMYIDKSKVVVSFLCYILS